ncbi:2-oxo-4-hydroxy-4-carboxy-5-ureidoimidazoline decarboxylase [Neobacillus ginsengisoli]|uniref:2-oxo-4-hydroxy-4-carboxy-5-ureidoimidazoline decarboxylase n=1 Tax=Neobacillus ginsengisoli TaxID=904295 RepID=A0ABT9XVJ5_9BACI|nr:2-oxo-4-hydroxy-4-carboxy-5-ureidoimidazoline decarboxylase [Neobacillus ginsengisoli]MDQ0199594.1 2-oxo-4-hydroxy-4-carboxy-5-ureidoimidazoline decarboxylase [Neobacillus ginsengisoli]
MNTKTLINISRVEMSDAMSFPLLELYKLNQAEFTKALGWVFEHSPWVAERAWVKQPFLTVNDLHHVMKNVVEQSSIEEKLALLRAHPDLAGRVQMADASIKEQAGAGLDRLSKEEHEEFLSLNETYTRKFGFPFIMAVKGQNKESIRASLKERVNNSPDNELKESLNQIYKIAFFRLEDFITS